LTQTTEDDRLLIEAVQADSARFVEIHERCVDRIYAFVSRRSRRGATSLGEPADKHYGERAGFVRDRFGNHWYIATPLGSRSLATALRTVTPALHLKGAGGIARQMLRTEVGLENLSCIRSITKTDQELRVCAFAPPRLCDGFRR
jgi:hypothetical protein